MDCELPKSCAPVERRHIFLWLCSLPPLLCAHVAEHILLCQPFLQLPVQQCSVHTSIRAGFLSRCAQLLITLGFRLPDLLKSCPVPADASHISMAALGMSSTEERFHSSAYI